MSKLIRKPGATSQIFQVFVRDSSSTTGGGLTGLTNASGSLTAYYHRDTDTTATAISLVTMTVGTFTSSGFKEVDPTNLPGVYQFCPPNAALAAGATSVIFFLKGATNMAPLPIEVDLQAQVDVAFVNAVATSSVTTINANIGQTQPLNFTGTGASALVKSDMVDVAGAAVATGTAQIGVNVVDIAGTASKGDAGYVGIDWAQIANQDAAVVLDDTQTSSVNVVLTKVPVDGSSVMTEVYSAPGAALTLESALYMAIQQMGDMSITGTTLTTKKRDQVTTAKTYTLNDGTSPTAITETT
tara:strand:+ start:36 stop:932 length:897 start_codon:yes stop_codon:yes gene_type:complete